MEDIYTGIKDRNGEKVYNGATIVVPYIDPAGNTHLDTDDGTYKIEFKYGCFGVQTPTRFVPLVDMLPTKIGDYVPNNGNIVIYCEPTFKVENKTS